MISRKIAGASAASVGAATAVAALLLGTVSGNAEQQVTASGYGIAARGLVPIEATPQVTAPPDGQDALVELPSPLGAGVLTVKVAGNTATATAVDLNIADLVEAQIIKATCDNGVGDVEILGGEIGGSALPSNPLGEGLDLLPLATVEVDRQTEHDDGSLTVEALVISVLPGGQVPDQTITTDTLDQLKVLAPGLKVPNMAQLQSDPAPAADAPAEEAPAEGAPAEEAPAEEAPAEEAPAEEAPAEEADPTLEDLLGQLTELNPGLELPTADGDALLEVIISSATCGADEGPIEAPRPEPIETQLPVTH